MVDGERGTHAGQEEIRRRVGASVRAGGTDFNRHVVSSNARAGAERAGAGGARFTRSHLRCVLPPGVVLDRRLQGARRGRRVGRHRNRGLERGGQAVLEGRDQDRVDAQGCDRSA